MREDRRQVGGRLEAPIGGQRQPGPLRWPAATLLYALVGAVVCFWRLGATGLVSMEGMVVDGARRMLESGDWLVPRVYGELYFYKPAMAYWLASLPLQLFEDPSEALLRLPFAASGFAMGLAVLVLVGRQAGWRAGLLGALGSVTGILVLQKARMMEFDVSLAAGVGVAVAAACHNLTVSRQRWSVWLVGYIALAAGFLTKGVPALMVFGPGLLAAAVAVRGLRRLFEWRHLSAVLLFTLICGSYLWGVWESAGPAAFQQPLVEARVRGLGQLSEADLEALPEARRFTGPEDGRTPGWVSYLGRAALKPVLVATAFLPWTVLLLFAFRRTAEPRAEALDALRRCAAGFVLTGTLMFMLTPTQETRYFLPLSVPMGILCGLTAEKLIGSTRERRALGVSLGVALLIAAATVVLALRLDSPPIPPGHRPVLIAVGAAGALASLYLWRRGGRHRLPLVLGVAAFCAMMAQYLGVEPYRASSRDLRPVAEELEPHLPSGEPLWVLGPSDEAGKHASLFYYLGRPVRAFRFDSQLPATGAHCVLTAANLESLAGASGFAFQGIARAEHRWFTYHLGICSGLGVDG